MTNFITCMTSPLSFFINPCLQYFTELIFRNSIPLSLPRLYIYHRLTNSISLVIMTLQLVLTSPVSMNLIAVFIDDFITPHNFPTPNDCNTFFITLYVQFLKTITFCLSNPHSFTCLNSLLIPYLTCHNFITPITWPYVFTAPVNFSTPTSVIF